ncbi:MAG TPA: sigma-70 family RNA polymerase sigma factor [Rhodoblastus sp.]|nr:sigma-70 family RNA polymerase sigma factor [Rhodoblastus sp.]
MSGRRPDFARVVPAARSERGLARSDGADSLAQAIVRIATYGDKAAFQSLFEALAPAVKGLALRQGADPATADEIVQDTFLTIWRKASLYAPERGGAAGWVYAIARNVRIDRLRREPAWQALTDEAGDRPADEPPADEAMAAGQIQSRVRAVLDQLPPEQAAAVRLAFFDGLSHAQIAAATGAPLGTVKTRINLAYQKLRAAMQDFR